jgi:hypothetical protein
LRLLYGGFMREALGLLEEQILAYRSMRERAVAAVAVQLAGAYMRPIITASPVVPHHYAFGPAPLGANSCTASWRCGGD